MIERSEDITTKDGSMTTFITYPERDGPFPLVLFLMDGAGIRECLRDMARRLATVGYYVMLPNLFYRTGVLELPEGATYDDMGEFIRTLTMPMTMSDCDALLDFADGDAAARQGKAGAVGYCMSGQYAVNVAARHPGRISAAASFHGTWLVTDEPDSPHLMMQKTDAEFYFGAAELDQWAPLDEIAALARTVEETGVNAEVEILKGLDHGFVFPERPMYDKLGTERHWERLLALFKRRLV